MSGKSSWDDSDLIVNPNKDLVLYGKAMFPTVVGKISGPGGKISMPQGAKIAEIDLGSTNVIREKPITLGNEVRLTYTNDPSGMANYGDLPAETGSFASYKHVKGWVNEIDSKSMPIPGRCSRKMVMDVINDPKSDAIADRIRWAGEEMDADFMRAILMGASRGILSATSLGGLYKKLYNCGTGGLQRSCYNFYGANGGFATPSVVQATHEANVATRISALADNGLYGFDIGEHRKMREAIKTKKFRPITVNGKTYCAIALADPDLLWRLATDTTYTNLMSTAAVRGMDNPAIAMMNPIVLDDIAYIPYERQKAFRPSVVSSAPVYGAANTYDPRTYSNTQKICLIEYLGADAILRGTDQKVRTTVMSSRDEKAWEVFVSWDDGFTRAEPGTYDSSAAALENTSSIVGAWYDPGVGVAFTTP